MTVTHSRKVVQQLSVTWPYGLECWGHDPVEKKNQLGLCTLRVHRVEREMESTGVCCDKFI